MADEREFEVIDRRRPTTVPTAAAEDSDTQTESPSPLSDDPADQPADDEEPFEDGDLATNAAGPASAIDIVTMSLGMLNEIAWVKMGLVPDPMSGQMAPDLGQARLAIDCAGDLSHRLSSHVDGKTQRELETLIQNLKLNYVKQQQQAKQ